MSQDLFSRFTPIREYSSLSRQQFFAEIVPAQKPVVIRNHARNWPLVKLAKRSCKDWVAYVSGFYSGKKVMLSMAPPEADKRFFYNENLTGLTFVSGEERVDRFLLRLLELQNRTSCPALSMQSALIADIFPALMNENRDAYFKLTKPRLWVGNQGVVDTHYDGSDNLACVVAGRRRFVLFPPDQTANLYPGPLDFTPAGVPVSLVNLRCPDYERFPNYKLALEQACSAELGPGDAIFMPMLWWHYVESLEWINGLVNYWWNGSFADDATSPNLLDSLRIAIFAMREMTPRQRRAWRCLFDHYLFKRNIDPASYIPAHQHHLLGEMSPEYIRSVKDFFVQKLQS